MKKVEVENRKQLLAQVQHKSGNFITIFTDKWTGRVFAVRYDTLGVNRSF
jgi:hypothetical protein